jgi:hypothetical protein
MPAYCICDHIQRSVGQLVCRRCFITKMVERSQDTDERYLPLSIIYMIVFHHPFALRIRTLGCPIIGYVVLKLRVFSSQPISLVQN